MALQTWDPWTEVRRFRDELNRVFERQLGADLFEPADFPPLNVRREADRVVIEALLPGVAREDLDVTATGDTITLRGERRAESAPAERYQRRERNVGRFVRTVRLDTRLASDQTTATYRDGVLRVEVRYAPEAKPQRVQIAS